MTSGRSKRSRVNPAERRRRKPEDAGRKAPSVVHIDHRSCGVMAELSIIYSLADCLQLLAREVTKEDVMKTKLLAVLLLAGSSVFAGTRFFVGFGTGGYYPGYYAA